MKSLAEHRSDEPLAESEVDRGVDAGREAAESLPVPSTDPAAARTYPNTAGAGSQETATADEKPGWNEWAITSFVAAFASPLTVLLSGIPVFAVLSGLFVIFGIVAGHMGLREAKRSPQLRGRGLGIVGIVLSYTQLVAAFGMILLLAAFVGLVSLTL